jgi:hypothetical protein
MASENLLLAREQTRLLGEILAELRARPEPIAAILSRDSCFELSEDDGLPVTPGLDDAIGEAFHALGIERVSGRVAAVTLAVRKYLGGLTDD